LADRSSLSTGKLLLLPALSLALLGGFQVDTSEAAMMGGASQRFAKSYRTPRARSISSRPQLTRLKRSSKSASRAVATRKEARASRRHGRGASKVAHAPKHVAAKAIPPQLYLEKLNQLTLKPGVVHKFCKGGLNVNVVEVDMKRADVKVRPFLASETFDKLKNVEQHAKESGALVAVNANYFKKDGTPLGTIKVDDEWVSGSLFNRVAMGITRDNDLKFARVNLHGILETSNPKVRRLWVNNMNQPRRSGVRLIMYTRRWGNHVTLPYEGKLVAVSNKGEVLDTHGRSLTIPYGGYVLTDKKDSDLAHLRRGDFVDLDWQTDPRGWNQVTHAISGGPTLIKEGQLFVALKDEKFKGNWTSAKITRRTACGVTEDRRLILTTVEGPHTLWDLAKFMKQLGCVEAMNLDGGGSTTMVVNGNTVTRNDCTGQRKVAATICVMEPEIAQRHERRPDLRYQPSVNLTEFAVGTDYLSQIPMMNGIIQARIQQRQFAEMTMAGDGQGKFLGPDQALAPADSIDANGVVCKIDEADSVIDIDNDLYRVSGDQHTVARESKTKDEPKLDNIPQVKTHKNRKDHKVESSEPAVTPDAAPAKVVLASPAIKATAVQPSDKVAAPTSGWTNKIFKPFKFGRRS
jgi:uncharacterized protein YigE (DUF2233 family)